MQFLVLVVLEYEETMGWNFSDEALGEWQFETRCVLRL